MDFTCKLARNLFCVLWIPRQDDFVALAGKNGVHQVAHGFLIFDQQNGFGAALFAERHWLWPLLFDLVFHAWQVHFEGAAFSEFTVYPDVSATLLDDSIHSGKPQPRAAPA